MLFAIYGKSQKTLAWLILDEAVPIDEKDTTEILNKWWRVGHLTYYAHCLNLVRSRLLVAKLTQRIVCQEFAVIEEQFHGCLF